MASPALHVKDSYFFEVPKSMWHPQYKTMDDVPKFLRAEHPEETLEEFNSAMTGKILIPQPFGTLKNLYEAKSGFTISKFMLLELLVAVVLVVAFTWLTKKLFWENRPRGRAQNAMEMLVQLVRDDIARPAIGHDADDFVPFLLTAFFFILVANLAGMVPMLGAITGDIHVTAVLAFSTLGIGIYHGVKKMGYGGFILNFMPHMDLPWALGWLKYMIFAIEIFGHLIKHAVLAIRLFANMVAGHMVIAGVLAMLIGLQGLLVWSLGTFVGVLGLSLFSLLELLVAFLQAYVFTMLSALFIGASVNHHGGAAAEHH
jgi:F-type H+-transporting ATPase subunit a